MIVLCSTDYSENNLFVINCLEEKIIKKIPFISGQENKNCDYTRIPHRPFGITWDSEYIYLANRKKLLVYDSNFNWIDSFEVLDENTHQIAIWNGKIIACMTSIDCIGVIDVVENKIDLFHPKLGWLNEEQTNLIKEKYYERGKYYDEYHINSLLVVDDDLYFLLNRDATLCKLNLKNKKFSKCFSIKTNKLCHNILKQNNDFLTLHKSGVLLNFNNNDYIKNEKQIDARLFFRGISGDRDSNLAYAATISTHLRHNRCRSFVKINNHKAIFVDGGITDMRRIDGLDNAHLNPNKFPYQKF